MKIIILYLFVIIAGGFFWGVLGAYLLHGFEGKGWSLCELLRNVRWVIKHDIIDIPWKICTWIKRNAKKTKTGMDRRLH